MPMRAPRPCRAQMCRGTTTASHGYCQEHAHLSSGWNKPGRATAQKRGYGHDWKKRRDAAMVRDDWLCQPCKRKGRLTPAVEVDHVIPKSQGGTDDDDNLQAICDPCHKAKTAREARC